MQANRTVLLLEDDLDHVSIISYILETEGFKVVLADPRTYRKDIEKFKPDVVILDHWLVGALGSNICLELKADSQTSNIPVILTSASNKIEVIAEGCKPDDILPKPFDLDELVQKVRRLINSREADNAARSNSLLSHK